MKARSKSIFVGLFVLVPILLVNLACGLSAAATETPVPTDTPLPTSTSTPKPTATATPNLRATQAAEQELAIRNFLTSLDLPADTGSIGWVQDQEVSIDVQGLDWQVDPFAADVIAGDFVLYTQITWETDAWPFCGILFRSDGRGGYGDWYEFDILRFSGLPAFGISYYKDGTFINYPSDKWRFSSFLDLDDGATNEIVLAAQDNQFKVYINGNFEGQYYDWSSRLSEGSFLFSVYQESGNTTCTFDNSWIWLYK